MSGGVARRPTRRRARVRTERRVERGQFALEHPDLDAGPAAAHAGRHVVVAVIVTKAEFLEKHLEAKSNA